MDADAAGPGYRRVMTDPGVRDGDSSSEAPSAESIESAVIEYWSEPEPATRADTDSPPRQLLGVPEHRQGIVTGKRAMLLLVSDSRNKPLGSTVIRTQYFPAGTSVTSIHWSGSSRP